MCGDLSRGFDSVLSACLLDELLMVETGTLAATKGNKYVVDDI